MPTEKISLALLKKSKFANINEFDAAIKAFSQYKQKGCLNISEVIFVEKVADKVYIFTTITDEKIITNSKSEPQFVSKKFNFKTWRKLSNNIIEFTGTDKYRCLFNIDTSKASNWFNFKSVKINSDGKVICISKMGTICELNLDMTLGHFKLP